MNRVLHRPLEELWVATPPTLADPELITGFGRLNAYVDNSASFFMFKEFMVGEGLAASPELDAVDAVIDARPSRPSSWRGRPPWRRARTWSW